MADIPPIATIAQFGLKTDKKITRPVKKLLSSDAVCD